MSLEHSPARAADHASAPQSQPQRPEYLTAAQVEEIYGIRGLAVRRVRNNGPRFSKLGTARGSRILYARADVESWLEAQKFANTSEFSAAQAMAGAADNAAA